MIFLCLAGVVIAAKAKNRLLVKTVEQRELNFVGYSINPTLFRDYILNVDCLIILCCHAEVVAVSMTDLVLIKYLSLIM